MKKSILFVAALFFIGSTITFAQKFGVQAGATFSSLNQKIVADELFSLDWDYKNKTFFTGGIYGNFNLGKNLAIQPEINYLPKGGVYTGGGDEITLMINYIEVPVYLLYKGSNDAGFFGGIGPSFNYGISGKYKMADEEEKIEFGKDKDIQAFHMALNAQAGYQFTNGFAVNAFISQSLTNSESEMAVDDEEFSFTANNQFSFLSFGLRVGYRFNLNTAAGKSPLKTVL